MLRALAVLLASGAVATGAVLEPGRDRAGDDLRVRSSATGALRLSEGPGFTFARLVPGDRGTGTLTLTNRGDATAAYDLVPDAVQDVAGRLGGRLSARLELAVQDVTAADAPRLLFAGRLGALTGPLAIGPIAAGATRTLRFDVAWEDGGPDDGRFAGAATSVVYRFTATRPDPSVAASSTAVPALAAGRSCLSRRRFAIRVRVPRGFRVRSTRVFVAGRRVRVVAGARLRAVVDLRRMPRRTMTVEIAVRGADGRTLVGRRTYRTCAVKRPARRAPRL